MGISQKVEAVGMYSADGEFVEFGLSVPLEGPVEVSLLSSQHVYISKLLSKMHCLA